MENKEKLSDSLSSLMGTCHYLGESLGPFFGGMIVEEYGFDNGSAFFGLTILIYMVFFMIITGGCLAMM